MVVAVSMRAMSSAGMSELLTVMVSLTVPTDSVAFTVALADRELDVGSLEFRSLQLRDDARALPSGNSGAR